MPSSIIFLSYKYHCSYLVIFYIKPSQTSLVLISLPSSTSPFALQTSVSSSSKMMKIQKSTILLAIICFLLIHEMYLGQQLMASAQKIDCGGKCNYRCSKASRQKMCLRACNTCCQRCNCVPPGTSGNTDVCPCYARMTTHGGKLKCP